MSNNLNKKLHYVQSEHNPQAMEELKPMTAEWMPVNPCNPKCDLPIEQCEVCAWHIQKYEFELKLSTQKKLLEYLIKTAESNLGGNIQIAVITWLKSMLKQLEEMKD